MVSGVFWWFQKGKIAVITLTINSQWQIKYMYISIQNQKVSDSLVLPRRNAWSYK